MVAIRKPVRLPLGQVVATPGALRLLHSEGISPASLLRRHAVGDWGCVPPDDGELNDLAAADGSRILSAYHAGRGKVWIVTECDRSATTILLPDEY
jgi:hypothetical protein